jgi:uncharacterized protein (TIRG00374 family)
MTPLNFFAGDPVRVVLLKKQMGGESRLGSVIYDRIMHTLASLIFVLTGMLLAFTLTPLLSITLRFVLITVYLALITAVAVLVIDMIRGRGLKKISPFLWRLGLLRRFPKIESILEDLNRELGHFSKTGGLTPFCFSFFYHFVGRVLGAGEIAIIFLFLNGSLHLLLSVILASLTTVVHLLFTAVPGAFGVVESMYGGFFYFFNMDPADGIAMQLTRRIRAAIWLIFGVLLLNFRLPRQQHRPGGQKAD